MRNFSVLALMICVSSILAGCQSVSGCGPFVANNLSPNETVALLAVGEGGGLRVIGNDRAGERLGCW